MWHVIEDWTGEPWWQVLSLLVGVLAIILTVVIAWRQGVASVHQGAMIETQNEQSTKIANLVADQGEQANRIEAVLNAQTRLATGMESVLREVHLNQDRQMVMLGRGVPWGEYRRLFPPESTKREFDANLDLSSGASPGLSGSD